MLWIKTYGLQLLGGALLASLLLNVGLGTALQHSISARAEYHAVVKATTKAATEKKQIVETRDRKVVQRSEDRITHRIANATSGLHNSHRSSNLPGAALTPNLTISEGGTTIFLPEGDSATDRNICITNTILSEEWQSFYESLRNVREEENVGTDSQVRTAPSSP